MLWFYQLSLLTLRAFMVKLGGDLTWAMRIRVQTASQIYAALTASIRKPLQHVINRAEDTLTYRITCIPAFEDFCFRHLSGTYLCLTVEH